ncbi:hypothetical protein L3X38_002479 [Prunus dulcis]|uniref:Uncharacterized protein n=1 Tax=Prunus dulcis TaxID=3755 RepID=A0AAD4WXP3_PRUDU|nr:hypothetical protein L3X38_002479 [Prunus dulcis]
MSLYELVELKMEYGVPDSVGLRLPTSTDVVRVCARAFSGSCYMGCIQLGGWQSWRSQPLSNSCTYTLSPDKRAIFARFKLTAKRLRRQLLLRAHVIIAKYMEESVVLSLWCHGMTFSESSFRAALDLIASRTS